MTIFREYRIPKLRFFKKNGSEEKKFLINSCVTKTYLIVLKLGTSHIVKQSAETESKRFLIGLNFKTKNY